MIWLPIATSKTYGFRSAHDAFMTTYNGTGAPAGWNWCLSYLATAGILIGFDASGHVAEETRNASVAAAQGIFWSTVVSGLGGFAVVILFLFCVVSFKLPVFIKWCNFINPFPFAAASRNILQLWRCTAICTTLRCCPRRWRPHLHEHHLYYCSMVCKFTTSVFFLSIWHYRCNHNLDLTPS